MQATLLQARRRPSLASPARLRPHLPALIPGLVAVALFLVWAVHDGGFNTDTWYWGALGLIGVLAASLVLLAGRRPHPPRLIRWAIALFALYVAWSYLSIIWAQAPGVALDGSNRALLYLVVFMLMALLPWTARAAMAALLVFTIGVGVIALVLIVRLAAADRIADLIIGGRLAAPTGYFNSSVALFMIDALLCVGLAARRRLPALLRGLLVALAGASLQLAVIGQSRGWLFTLPLVVIAAIVVVKDRLRVTAAAILPIAVTVVPLRRLLRIYGPGLNHAAPTAAREALVLLGTAFVAGSLLAWGEQLYAGAGLARRGRMLLGTLAAAVAIIGCVAVGLAVSHGRPLPFIEREWRGFSHETTAATGSHFTDVGGGRYDYWRVAIDAFLAHPVGGLGQDNFADYYVIHRRTGEEPAWVHSWELRLLAHTGIVGFVLFVGFLGCAIAAAVRTRRRGPPLAQAAAGIALLPLVVWAIHGSIDWFWEMPALSGPTFGFLGMAGALAARPRAGGAAPAAGDAPRAEDEPDVAVAPTGEPRALPASGLVGTGLAVAGAVVAVVLLAFPYLSVRYTSTASDISATQPARALRDLATAARLDPLSSDPGRLAGAIALEHGEPRIAAQRFAQSIREEPDGWFSWLGAGLAASALGNRATARRDYLTADHINRLEPAITAALRRVDTGHPLSFQQALGLLVVAG